MATGYKLNGKDLDDILQPVNTNGFTLPTPTFLGKPDFSGYFVNGIELKERYAGVEQVWHKKMPRSYLSNGHEIEACLKGFYPIDKSFLTITTTGVQINIQRTDDAITVSGGVSARFTASTFAHNGGIVPYVIGIAMCGAGGGGGAGNGTQSASGGGGGGMCFALIDFTQIPTATFGMYLGNGGSRASGGTGSRPNGRAGGESAFAANDLTGADCRVICNGGKGGVTQGSTTGGSVTISKKGTAIPFLQTVTGGSSANQAVGSSVSWAYRWGTSDACTRNGKGEGGAHPGSGGGGGASYGPGGKGGQNSTGSAGSNGGGGGGGAWRIFDGQSGGNGGNAIAWLYY